MISTTRLRLVLLASIAIVIATAASAQVVVLQPGAPSDPMVAPGGLTGSPSGPSGTIGTGSTLNGDWTGDAARKMDGNSPTGSRKDAARPAAAADLIVGAAIADIKGVEIGYVKSVDPAGVVVATGAGPVRVPAEAFGKNKKGLLIGMSKADFDKLVANAS
jgi:hypothetical protein